MDLIVSVDRHRAFEHTLNRSAPDFVVTLDAAGHHDAQQLPDLVRAHLAGGSGVTIGSRWMHAGAAPDTWSPSPAVRNDRRL